MKKKIFKIIIVIILLVTSIMIGRSTKNDEVYEEVLPEVSKNLLSMMLEDENGEYILEKRDSWPSKEDGYVFNKELSKCNNGSKVTWDDENNVVLFEGTSIDKCYVYFDIYKSVTLANYIKDKFTGVQGENGLYYHTSSLENGAGDNSYRYAGANPDNFVCFGSDNETCPNDNLYRIIGVFDDQVKLIKYDYATTDLLGTDGEYGNTVAGGAVDITKYIGNNSSASIGIYYWNKNNKSITVNSSGYYNDWKYSELNTINLNTNYIKNIGNTWASKIATTTWIVGGNAYVNIRDSKASDVYINEILNPVTNQVKSIYEDKIGLMYVSDYGFAADSTAWSSILYNYNSSSIKNVNWIYMGIYEWTITRSTDETGIVYVIRPSGTLSYNFYVDENLFAVRPVFYLNSDVLVEGEHLGTSSDPFRIS